MSFGVSNATVTLGATVALHELTLEIPAGSVTAVVGGDGAGKTTLCRAVVGNEVLTSGSVHAPEPAQIGYLPSSVGSWRGLSVAENVAFVGGVYGLSGRGLAQRADELLGAAGLDDFRDRLAGQLSGGMRHKLGFVLATLHAPALLVLDEPTTGVDPVSRVDLWRLTAQAAAAGAAVLMSTTYLDEAQRAGHLMVLDRGRELVYGRPDAVLAGLPGAITSSTEPVRPPWAWRRGRVFHEYWPAGQMPSTARAVAADLEDVVIAHTLLAGAAGPESLAVGR